MTLVHDRFQNRNFYGKYDVMKILALVVAVASASTLVSPLSAGTLQVTFEDSRSFAYGPTGSTVLASPIVTLGFANSTDYATLADASAGPLFTSADLAFVEWTRIENLGFIEQNPAFENPPLTQQLFDTLTYTFSAGPSGAGIFRPVTGDMVTGSSLGFALSSTTSFVDGPMVILNLRGLIIEPSGNWDSDSFSDAATWDFGRTSFAWDPSATSFDNAPPDGMSAVPVPATLPLILSGLGALLIAGRQRGRSYGKAGGQ